MCNLTCVGHGTVTRTGSPWFCVNLGQGSSSNAEVRRCIIPGRPTRNKLVPKVPFDPFFHFQNNSLVTRFKRYYYAYTSPYYDGTYLISIQFKRFTYLYRYVLSLVFACYYNLRFQLPLIAIHILFKLIEMLGPIIIINKHC